MSGGTVAVDVGGTSIKALAADAAGGIVDVRRIPTARDGGRSLVQLERIIADLAGAVGGPAARVGVAVPGLVADGVVALAANLGWRDLALADRLTERAGVTVRVENDARAGALAERMWAWPDGGDLAFVPIGTGVAASHTAFGRAVQGATGSAGEFGHLRAVDGGEPCTCGNVGCVEAYASAAKILTRYHARGGTASTVPELITRRADDPLAAQVWDDAVAALGAGLLSLITLLDPSRIVIGGGLSLAGDDLLVPLRTTVAAALAWRTPPPIVASALGARSALVGAALLATGDDDATAHRRARGLATQLAASPSAVAR